MPIFEYHCTHCDHTIEKIQSKPLDTIPCSTCGNSATRTVSLTSISVSDTSGFCSSPAGSGFT